MTLFFTLIAEWNPNAAPPLFFAQNMHTLDRDTINALRTKRIGFALRITDMAHILGVTPACYTAWESGTAASCSDNNFLKIRFLLEGLLDSFIQLVAFPISKDDSALLNRLFSHRALLEAAASRPDILDNYKAALASIAIECI